ncbi:MAG: polyribonucleotide nucleotidyltransferase, partial [Planctomycetota bacterium]
HGMLAEKALAPVLPNKTDFPYTMRLVSESMASNGSTSQAAICGMSLALMDGGVPITRPVAGIAMGVMTDPKDPSNFKVLTDIQGPEDHHGDMDFKVAGTREGITAIQMDVKVSGIVLAALIEGLEQAKTARLHILDAIESEIASPRTEISQHAPKIESIKIDPEYIGRIIGKGGETIHKLQDETQTTITIEEDGTIFVTGLADAPSKAVAAISAITKEWKPGDKVVGTVKKILDDVGAIVTLSAYTDGMVHISEIANFRVNAVADFLTEGQEIPVTVMKVDKAKGRIGLSIKADNPDFIKPKQ